MTGAAKNLFGVIPSLEKPAMHARFKSVAEFSEMILDLNELMRPRLQIMDAVMGMEGDGPNSGDPRRIGVILASGDFSALDSVAARLMSLEPMDVGTFAAAAGRGLIRPDATDVMVVGDELARYAVKDFRKPKTLSKEKARIRSSKCIRCYCCHEMCEHKAIELRRSMGGKAIVRLVERRSPSSKGA